MAQIPSSGDAGADTELERLAERRRSAIEAGRRKCGVAGAAMAGAMVVVADIVEGPRRDDGAVTVEASGEPDDIDRDGVSIEVGGLTVSAPPLDPLPPVGVQPPTPPRR